MVSRPAAGSGPALAARPIGRHRTPGAVVARLLAAILGGYGLTYAATGVLALALPVVPSAAAYLSAMISFPLYVGAIIWAFAARTITAAWTGLLVVALPLAAALIAAWPHP